MLNDMCSDYAKKMEDMIDVFVKMDENEAGTSTVPGTRKRRRITEEDLEESADIDAEDDEYEEENDEGCSGEESDDTEVDGVEDDSGKEDEEDNEDCSSKESDDGRGNGSGQAGNRASDDGQAAVDGDDDQQVPGSH